MSEADVIAYIESLAEPRRAQLARMHRLIREEAPELEPKMWDYSGALIAYGQYHYKSKSTEGEWFPIGIAARKAYVSVYSMAMVPGGGGYYVKAFAAEHGFKAGNSCLNLKDPSAVDGGVLREFIAESVRLMREQSLLAFARA